MDNSYKTYSLYEAAGIIQSGVAKPKLQIIPGTKRVIMIFKNKDKLPKQEQLDKFKEYCTIFQKLRTELKDLLKESDQ